METSFPEKRFSWKKGIGLFFLALLMFGLFAFLWKVVGYYRAIRSGEANPLLERRLESSVSRLQANSSVTDEDLLRLHPPSAPSYGNPEADLVVVEFLDFDCPFCLETFSPLRETMERYRDRVYFIFRDFPIEDIHPGATSASLAARCAQDQGKYWEYHDKLFAHPDERTDADFLRFAKEVGVDETPFSLCYTQRRHDALIQAEIADGLRAGVQGTPTFFFNGIKVQGAMDAETLSLLLDTFLKQAHP